MDTMNERARAPAEKHPEFRRLLAWSILLAAAQGTNAYADTELAPVIVAAPENAGPLQLDRRTTTGSRTGLSARELPASIDIVTTEAMRERGDFSIKDGIVRSVGLTNIGTLGNGGMAFSTRGIAAVPGTNSIGIAEDGVSLAAAAGTINYPGDAWGYERIEVLRGPASVVFGVGTVGATINAVRNAPSREGRIDTLLGVGSHDSARLGVGATGPLGEIASFRIDAYGDRSNGYRDMGETRNGKLMTTLRLDPSSDLRFEALADYSVQRPERYWGTPLANGRIDSSLRKQNYNIGDASIRFEDTRLRLRAEWQANPWLTLRNEAFFLQADRYWKNVRYYALNPNTRQVTRSNYTEIEHDQTQRGNRLEAAITAAGHKAVLGWEVSKVDFRHINNAPYGGSSVVPALGFDHGHWISPDQILPKYDTDTTMQAFYVEDAYEIDERWLLLAGVRRDIFDVDRRELVPGPGGLKKTLAGTALRLGITYRPNTDTSLYLQGSTGYDPIVNIVSLDLANRNFTLTRGRQVEAGIKQSFAAGKGDWTAAVYRIEKDDIITRDPANPAISVQGGSQHAQGIELAIGIAPWEGWRFEGNYTVLQARYDELMEAGGVSRAGKRPTNVPERAANAWAHYRWSDWQLSLGARYVAKRYGDNANTLVIPAYTVADAGIAWHVDKATTIRAFVRNIADKVYATTAFRTTQFMLGEARSFELVAETKF